MPRLRVVRRPATRETNSKNICKNPAFNIQSIKVHNLTTAAFQLAQGQPRSGKSYCMEPDCRVSHISSEKEQHRDPPTRNVPGTVYS